MKRNLDLVRLILLKAEEKNTPSRWIIPSIEGFSGEEVAYHIKILIEANLIDGIDLTTSDGYQYGIRNLTWEGHEFLDAARDEGIWKKAKQKFGSKIFSVSFDIVKDLLISLTRQELGLT
jgi:hypothetical protein